MSFPSNPSIGDHVRIGRVNYFYSGSETGWYRTYVGDNGQQIKSFIGHPVRLALLETQMADLLSKSFLELE